MTARSDTITTDAFSPAEKGSSIYILPLSLLAGSAFAIYFAVGIPILPIWFRVIAIMGLFVYPFWSKSSREFTRHAFIRLWGGPGKIAVLPEGVEIRRRRNQTNYSWKDLKYVEVDESAVGDDRLISLFMTDGREIMIDDDSNWSILSALKLHWRSCDFDPEFVNPRSAE